ncbi:MAG: type 4a pilus biogenesis protein PilO [Candidatus Doudnabacteria bacterium]
MAQLNFRSIIFTVFILIIAAFASAYFLATPQWKKYSDNKVQLSKLQSDSIRLKQELDSVQTFLDSFNSHQKDASTASLSLPVNSADLANFLTSLGDLAKSAGVLVSNITFDTSPVSTTNPVVPNTIQVVKVNLTATGSYASFKDFVIRMEQHMRIINVGHFSLKADDNGLLSYQIALQTYFQK